MAGIEKACKECGSTFMAKRHNTSYCCEKCKHKGKLKNNAASRQRRLEEEKRQKEQEEKARKKKRKRKSDLAAVNERARAAGMTYGKYMAQEYAQMVRVERRK